MTDFKPGDTIRVTYEGKADTTGLPHVWGGDNTGWVGVTKDATVEVVQPVDLGSHKAGASGMTHPKPGDKVRVMYEGTWGPDHGVIADGITDGGALTWPHTFGGRVEVIQPVDDPSKDSVGTVRKDSEGLLFVRAVGHDDSDPWLCISSPLAGSWFSHMEIAGCEKLAPVEGTPAAEPQKVAHAFEPSHSGMVCGRMVIRDGYGDSCGLPADAHGSPSP